MDEQSAWEARMNKNNNLDRALNKLDKFIENPYNEWHLYDGLRMLLGDDKADEIYELLEI